MKARPDYILLGISIILVFLGMLVLATVSAPFSLEKHGTTTYFLFHQIIYALIPGIILGFTAFKLPLSFIKKNAFNFLLINLIFLALVFLPKIGLNSGGAARWISLGPISFQPSELLKPFFILYLAAWLARPSFSKKNFLPFLIIIGLLSLFLILQPDISTLGIIVLTASLMYFSANTPILQSVFIVLGGIGSLFLLIKIAPYRLNRILVFLKPEIDPLGIGYQMKQALIAVGSGGLLGVGLGMSHQKFGFLPQSIGDSIFAIFAEETGFMGSLLLILLFLGFAWQGLKIAKSSNDAFLRLAALGISSWIVIQGFINISSMLRIFPLTGIPLPFISYGGSHLIAELIGIGILLNISKQKP
ncbi:cell division protein FtsW [Candidatus Parcubacteria bacterium]|nr:cell division protein FtsW [Candidatus Parcubacteria bacterium]